MIDFIDTMGARVISFKSYDDIPLSVFELIELSSSVAIDKTLTLKLMKHFSNFKVLSNAEAWIEFDDIGLDFDLIFLSDCVVFLNPIILDMVLDTLERE